MKAASRLKKQELVAHYEPIVERCRLHLMQGLADAPLSDTIVKYFKGGKMLRARLVFASASAVGGDPNLLTLAAEAVELLHGASLVHDDIIDEANERRGMPALHTQLGIGTALALGDYLLLRAFAIMTEACIAAQTQGLELLTMFSSYGQECCRGQIAELGGSGKIDSEEDYFAMVRGKTGSLFAAAATTGAILGGGTCDEIQALHGFGLSLGISYQIYDDVLEVMGEPEASGKSIGGSISQGRPLLPLIYLSRHGTPGASAVYAEMHRRKKNRNEIASLLEREGIFNLIMTTQDAHTAAAQASLTRLRPSGDRAKLSAFLESCRCRRASTPKLRIER